MKTLQTLLIILIIIGSLLLYHNRDTFFNIKSEKLYYDKEMIIISFGNDCSLSNDKFETPQLCNSVLLMDIDSNFVSLNSCRDLKKTLKVSWFYNHHIGDTLHFDYILKKRFFKIERISNSLLDKNEEN